MEIFHLFSNAKKLKKKLGFLWAWDKLVETWFILGWVTNCDGCWEGRCKPPTLLQRGRLTSKYRWFWLFLMIFDWMAWTRKLQISSTEVQKRCKGVQIKCRKVQCCSLFPNTNNSTNMQHTFQLQDQYWFQRLSTNMQHIFQLFTWTTLPTSCLYR